EVVDDVAVEGLAVLEGQLRRTVDGLRVIAVDVDDRRADDLRDVCGVERRPCRGWGCRVVQLVVDDELDRTGNADCSPLRWVRRRCGRARAARGTRSGWGRGCPAWRGRRLRGPG